jgi:hypothetical protein
MANLPKAKVGLTDTGGAVASGVDVLIAAGPVPSGQLFKPRLFTSVQALLNEHGFCGAIDFCAHYIELAQKPVFFVGMTPIAGSIGAMELSGVTGNAVATAAGTPVDDEDIKILFTKGGALATAGIEFKTSRDGGQTYSPSVRLGTALTYLIPDTGITVTLGTTAATYNANDVIAFGVKGPTFDSGDLTSLQTALASGSQLSRLQMLIGESDGTLAQAESDMVSSYESTNNRDTRALAALRPIYRPAKKATGGTVSFLASPKTVTRSVGDWQADGFHVGMKVTITGSVSNNVSAQVITVLTTTVMTLGSATLVDEATVSNVGVTGTESETDWMSALDAITLGKDWPRLLLGGGDAMRTSPINGTRKKRNASWAIACRYMAHDVQVSPADGTLGRLEGWALYNADNTLACHDERANGGLLHSRISCLTSQDTDPGGAFVALALCLTGDDRPLSRLPVACLGDLTCTIARAETTRLLNSRVILDPKTGYMTVAEQRRVEGAVLSVLRNELLAPKLEGQRASDITFSIDRNVDLRQPGAIVSWEADLTALGYLEQLSGTVRVQGSQ